MARRITIKPRTLAQMGGRKREAIAEVFSPAEDDHPARGCLIGVREVQNAGSRAGRGLVIEVYSADPNVFVRINRRDYRAPK